MDNKNKDCSHFDLLCFSVSHDESYCPGVSELSMAHSVDRWIALSVSTNPTHSASPQSEDSIHLVQMNTLHNFFESTYSILDPFLGGNVEELSDVQNIHPRIGLVNSAAATDEILFPESLSNLRDSLIWELDTTEWMFNRSTQNKL